MLRRSGPAHKRTEAVRQLVNTEGYTMFPGCTYIGSISVTGMSYPVRLHLEGASVMINMTGWKGP